MSIPDRHFFNIKPPAPSGEDPAHQVLSTATSAAAANYSWVTALGANAPEGPVWVTLEASTTDCWVRFKSTTSAAGTTTTNGLIIKAGQPGRPFYVNPSRHGVIDVISNGVGSLQVQVSSPVGARNYI